MNRTVFITGASRGIGAVTVKKFLQEGWQVAGFYREKSVQDTDKCKYFQMDAASRASVEEAMANAYKTWGRVDALVTCAGVFGFSDLQGYTEELMDKVMATNEKGTYLCVQAIQQYMETGSIVTISSVAGQIGSGSDPIYAGTKGAILAFTKSMAKFMAPKIRVNCVAPGMVETEMAQERRWEDRAYLTEMTPLGKIAVPEDIANGVYFLASDQASHITGACLDINGGYVMR